MRWDWLAYDMADGSYLWEFPNPLPPHSLTPPPRHTSHALGQRAPKPTIRSWLGGVGSPPPSTSGLDTALDTSLDIGYSVVCWAGRVENRSAQPPTPPLHRGVGPPTPFPPVNGHTMPDKLTDTERIHHLIDDLEKVRTHPIRTIQNVQPLLDDALHALENGSLDVVREFLERSRVALITETKWLRQYGNVK